MCWSPTGPVSYTHLDVYKRQYPDRVYSRGDAKEHMMEQMEDMMGGANEREKEIRRRAMDQLGKA